MANNIETMLGLAREFVVESDERLFNYDQAIRWFKDRRESIKVENVHPIDTTEYWKLIRVSEGGLGVLIPKIRTSGYDARTREFHLDQYFDISGYSSFDSLKAKHVLAFPVQISDGQGNWKTEKKGVIKDE